LLAWLGRLVGWPIAERALCTIAIVATFAVLARLSAGGPLPASIALASVAGWLSQGWFLWMGFYDFALSLAGYAALVLVLRLPPIAPVRVRRPVPDAPLDLRRRRRARDLRARRARPVATGALGGARGGRSRPAARAAGARGGRGGRGRLGRPAAPAPGPGAR